MIRLTEETVAAMAARYAEGMSLAVIAVEFGVSQGTVRRRLIGHGVAMRACSAADYPLVDLIQRVLRGERTADIAADLGTTQSALGQRLRFHGIKLGEIERYRVLFDMVPEALKELRDAMEEDDLPFEDALEIALEYCPKRRVA